MSLCLNLCMHVCITVVILSLKGALLNNETSFMDLLAGSIVNVSISVNFFVYYSISKEYRAIFDKVLGIGHIKAMLKRSMPAVVRRVTHLSNPSPVRITVAEVN
nr:7TM GPCR domain containing protein [Haemonchus contortus]